MVLESTRRVRRVRRRDAPNSRIKRHERLLLDRSGHLGTEAAGKRCLLDDDYLSGVLRRADQTLYIEWNDRSKIDDGDGCPFAGQDLSGRQTQMDAGTPTDQRQIGSLPDEPRVAALGDGAAHRPVEPLRLEEEDGVGVADGTKEEALRIGRKGGADDLDSRHLG